jgi:GAF domain-containing protein
MMLVVGLLAVATVAFAGLSVGVSPYAMVASALVASGVIAGRTRGGRKNRSTTRDPRRSASDELEKVTRAIDTVEEAIADLPSPDISVVLHTIALQAQILTDARYVALGFGTDPDRPLEPWIHLGMPPEVARALNRHPRPVGTLGRVACDGEVLRTQDVQRDPSFRGFPPGHPKMSSLLGVPIRFRGRAAGNLYLADKRGAAEFSEHDERLIVMLAARAGAAIETARLYAGEAQRHAWLRNTIDQMPEGLLLLDREGRTNAMNRALHAFLCEHAPDLAGFTSSKALDVRFPSGSPVPPEQLPSVRALQQGGSRRGWSSSSV